MLESKLVFIYDGQCPFCNHFAELLELKSNLRNIQVQNARENAAGIPIGYDMDTKGALLLKDDFPYEIPTEFDELPRLLGRANVTIKTNKGNMNASSYITCEKTKYYSIK